ncbi:hypothetical protein KSC_003220 [Ktedonobacter sp. SOSP1-52]|nr:hypothetical protein KSC_003220 [Ktedonobacter sp. SOSP1-52]
MTEDVMKVALYSAGEPETTLLQNKEEIIKPAHKTPAFSRGESSHEPNSAWRPTCHMISLSFFMTLSTSVVFEGHLRS